jgi:hypothetical protein
MRVIYLTIVTVIENMMRLVKRMFAELVLNAARNGKSAHQQVRQNEKVEASSARGPEFYRPRYRNMAGFPSASADDAGLTQPAYIVGIETSDRRTASLSSPRDAILPRTSVRPF